MFFFVCEIFYRRSFCAGKLAAGPRQAALSSKRMREVEDWISKAEARAARAVFFLSTLLLVGLKTWRPLLEFCLNIVVSDC